MGCSPIKEVRELGSERRETVRSLSAVGVGREDRDGHTSGASVVLPSAWPSSYVWTG